MVPAVDELPKPATPSTEKVPSLPSTATVTRPLSITTAPPASGSSTLTGARKSAGRFFDRLWLFVLPLPRGELRGHAIVSQKNGQGRARSLC